MQTVEGVGGSSSGCREMACSEGSRVHELVWETAVGWLAVAVRQACVGRGQQQ